MLVILQAFSGTIPGRRVQLRTDQVLRVGRSGWADFAFADDKAMIDVHFEVACVAEGCVVRALSPAAVTLVNGQAIASAIAYDGDEIQAGETRFRISIQGGPPRPKPEEQPLSSETTCDAPPSPRQTDVGAVGAAAGLVGLCAYLEFGDEISALAQTVDSTDELIALLAADKKFQDALRLRAYSLEKRQAVWWGCYCLREELGEPLPDDQTSSVDAAADWVKDPSETRRRAAEAQAAQVKYSGPGPTLALSAFWSDGSLAPEGSADVEPDERLTSQGVTAALVAAAYVGDPTKAPERFQAFLDRGQDVANGTIALPNGD